MNFRIVLILLASCKAEFCRKRKCNLCSYIMMSTVRTPAFSGVLNDCQKISSCCARKEQLGRSETSETRSGPNVLVVGVFGSLLGFAIAGTAFLMVKFLIDKHRDNSNFSQMRRQSRARSISQDALDKRRMTLTLPNDLPTVSSNGTRRESIVKIQTRGSFRYNNKNSRRPSSLSFICE